MKGKSKKKRNIVITIIVMLAIIAFGVFGLKKEGDWQQGMPAERNTEKQQVVVTFQNLESVYGDPLEKAQWTVEGLAEEDIIEVVPDAFEFYEVGEYEISGKAKIASTTSINYEVIVKNGVYTINPREITVKLYDVTSTYAELKHTSYSVTNVIWEYDPGIEIRTEAYTKGVGRYPIVAMVNNKNYEAEIENAIYTILPEPITVYVDDKESVYGKPMKELTGRIEGNVREGDSLGLVYKMEDVKGPGKYTITAEVDNPNYEVTVVNGTYTILSAKEEQNTEASTSTSIEQSTEQATTVTSERSTEQVTTVIPEKNTEQVTEKMTEKCSEKQTTTSNEKTEETDEAEEEETTTKKKPEEQTTPEETAPEETTPEETKGDPVIPQETTGNDKPGSVQTPTEATKPAPVQPGDSNNDDKPGSVQTPTEATKPAPVQPGDSNDDDKPGSVQTPTEATKPAPVQPGDSNNNDKTGSVQTPTSITSSEMTTETETVNELNEVDDKKRNDEIDSSGLSDESG